MNATAFYITLVTTQGVDLAEYDEVASAFVKAFYIVTSEHLDQAPQTMANLANQSEHQFGLKFRTF